MANRSSPNKIIMSNQTTNLNSFGIEAGVVDTELTGTSHQPRKPTVAIPGGSTTVLKSAKDLYTHIAPTHRLFLRDGKVYQLVDQDDHQILEELKPAAACSKFEEFVNFAKWKIDDEGNPQLVPTVLTKESAEKYLTAPGKKLLPEIRGMINCPMIVERNGALHIVQSGYDPLTKLYVSGDIRLPPVTLEDAVYYLKGILQEFDFQTPSDRSRAIASTITPALKFGGFLKQPIPADVAEADQSQAGKTHRQKITAALYNEEVNIVVKKEGGGVGSLEEAFGTALVQGRPFIQFDNVRGKLNSQNLESFMTATGSFPARPAYSKVVMIDPSKFMIFINSNGYQATPDLGNRSSIIRIKKRHGYEFKDMLGFVKDAQPLLLSSVFRVIEEWLKNGKKRTSDTRHDFREWSQTLDWIVQNIFKEAPLMDDHQEAQKRVSSVEYTFLRAVALALEQKHHLGLKIRATHILNLCQEANIPIPGLSPEKRNDQTAASMAVGKALGHLFEPTKNYVVVEDFLVFRSLEQTTAFGSDKEFESKTYTFQREDKIR
jgi:hypothetical protein